MKRARIVTTLLAVAVFVYAAAFVHLGAQAPPQPAEPRIGQPGKDAVWVPSPDETVEAMLDLAEVTPDDVVMDLGSGDGRIVIAAARRGVRAVGVEYDEALVELARRRAAEEGLAHLASFVQGDMFAADLPEATVLALFLMPENLRRLTPNFLQLPPGTRIVVNTFGIPDWEPDERQRVGGDCTSWCELMLYIVPAHAEGTWELPQGTLTLSQTFQMLAGTLVLGDRSLTLEEGRLRADEIQFTAGGTVYRGRMRGDVMEGAATTDGQEVRFSGRRRR